MSKFRIPRELKKRLKSWSEINQIRVSLSYALCDAFVELQDKELSEQIGVVGTKLSFNQ